MTARAVVFAFLSSLTVCLDLEVILQYSQNGGPAITISMRRQPKNCCRAMLQPSPRRSRRCDRQGNKARTRLKHVQPPRYGARPNTALSSVPSGPTVMVHSTAPLSNLTR